MYVSKHLTGFGTLILETYLLFIRNSNFTECPSPSYPIPQPAPLPLPFVCFPELGVSHGLSPSLIFPTHFLSFPLYYLSLFLYSPKEWDHIMFVLFWLTYFTQHNTLQFHPRWSKWWVFVVSNGWVIYHCIHRPQRLYPFIFRWTPRLLALFGYCGHRCYKHWGADVSAFHCICIFGVNPSSAIPSTIYWRDCLFSSG